MTDQEKIKLMWQTIDELNTLAYDHRGDKHMAYVYQKTIAILQLMPEPDGPVEDEQD